MSSKLNEDDKAEVGPPAGSPWDGPLARAPLVFVDLEMTGLDPGRDRVVQICVERVEGDSLTGRLLSFVRPEPSVELAAGTAIHGIGPSELDGAPTFDSIADRVLGLIAGGIIVAHGARYDVAFLAAELARLGRSWSCTHYLDTLALSRRALRCPSHRLTALAQLLGFDNPEAHRADNDVRVLRLLFEHLRQALRPSSARDLWHVSTARRVVRPAIVAAARRAAELGQCARVLYQPCGRAAQQLGFHVTSVRTDLDPPVVLGYLQHTRGRRELRADRILTFELVGHDPVEAQID